MIANDIIDEFCSQAQIYESKIIAQNLSSIILSIDSAMCLSIKWKKLTFALNDDFHHWICAINFTKKGTVLYFHFGGLLNDEYNVLISGESSFLRKIEFKTIEEIDKKIIKNYVKQAILKLDFFKNNWKEINAKNKLNKQ